MPLSPNARVTTTGALIPQASDKHAGCDGAVKNTLALKLPVQTRVPFPTDLAVNFDMPLEMTLSMKAAKPARGDEPAAVPATGAGSVVAPCGCTGTAPASAAATEPDPLQSLTPAEKALLLHQPRSLAWAARQAEFHAQLRVSNAVRDVNAGIEELKQAVVTARLPDALEKRLQSLEQALDDLTVLVRSCCKDDDDTPCDEQIPVAMGQAELPARPDLLDHDAVSVPASAPAPAAAAKPAAARRGGARGGRK